MTLTATIALVLALLFDWLGLLPRWLADRLAALCVLFAADYFLSGTTLAASLLSLGTRGTDWLAQALQGPLGPRAGEAVGRYGLGMVVLILFVIWAAMLAPRSVSNHAGDIVQKELSSKWIWLPPVAFVLAAQFIPGAPGDLVRGTVGLLTNAGQLIGDLATQAGA